MFLLPEFRIPDFQLRILKRAEPQTDDDSQQDGAASCKPPKNNAATAAMEFALYIGPYERRRCNFGILQAAVYDFINMLHILDNC